MVPVIFDSKTIQIVCISDTHNDDCRNHVPSGDIFIHAGDLTDDGSFEELQAAFNWISELPHKVKVIVAGNHDLGLDNTHPRFSQEALAIFLSPNAQNCGIHYLNRETRVVAQYVTREKQLLPIRVYGNPLQPDFLNSSYAFTYKPYPSDEAVSAWLTAPSHSQAFDIWTTHSPPRHRLDDISVPGLVGCDILAKAIAKARPMLCVFGHYHSSHGIERVRWRENCDAVDEAKVLKKSQRGEKYDFSDNGLLKPIQVGMETVFVNAAWMTMEKGAVTERNDPFVVELEL